MNPMNNTVTLVASSGDMLHTSLAQKHWVSVSDIVIHSFSVREEHPLSKTVVSLDNRVRVRHLLQLSATYLVSVDGTVNGSPHEGVIKELHS